MNIQDILWKLVKEVETNNPSDMMNSVWNETAVKVAEQKIKERIMEVVKMEGQHE